jgi:hypothetical protein
MPKSMLGPRTFQVMRKLQKDLFQTGLNMADPSISVVFSRYNPETEQWIDLPPQEVILRWRHDKKLIRVYGSMTTPLGSSPTPLDGMFLAFTPFDVKTGDRFTLQTLVGRVNTVWPPRNGKQRASFTVESDKRPV